MIPTQPAEVSQYHAVRRTWVIGWIFRLLAMVVLCRLLVFLVAYSSNDVDSVTRWNTAWGITSKAPLPDGVNHTAHTTGAASGALWYVDTYTSTTGLETILSFYQKHGFTCLRIDTSYDYPAAWQPPYWICNGAGVPFGQVTLTTQERPRARLPVSSFKLFEPVEEKITLLVVKVSWADTL